MSTSQQKAPVLLFTYRKHQFLGEIYEAIKSYSPPKLYISSNHYACNEERAIVESIRNTISQWEISCEIIYLLHDNYRTINDSIHYGLDHVLGMEDSVIVLEDDTVPSSSFFDFCNTMLARYRGRPDVGSIIGCNLGTADRNDISFTVPLALFYWGWATWADTWQRLRKTELPWGQHDAGLAGKLHDSTGLLASFFPRQDQRTTWDIQWGWSQAIHDLYAILPGQNLITNKGFVAEGSYIRFADSPFNNLARYDLTTNTPVIRDAILAARYETLTTNLLTEILAHRGELDYYSRHAN